MPQTQTKNGRKNGRKSTPDLLGTLKPKRGPGRPKTKPTLTAAQIADSLEAEAKRLQDLANILKGEA